MGLVPLLEQARELVSPLFLPCEVTRISVPLDPSGRGSSAEPGHAGTLISNLNLQNYEKKFLLFKLFRLWQFVILGQAEEDKDI